MLSSFEVGSTSRGHHQLEERLVDHDIGPEPAPRSLHDLDRHPGDVALDHRGAGLDAGLDGRSSGGWLVELVVADPHQRCELCLIMGRAQVL